jgi:hypothetical protein
MALQLLSPAHMNKSNSLVTSSPGILDLPLAKFSPTHQSHLIPDVEEEEKKEVGNGKVKGSAW